jgi:hypothetical protein
LPIPFDLVRIVNIESESQRKVESLLFGAELRESGCSLKVVHFLTNIGFLAVYTLPFRLSSLPHRSQEIRGVVFTFFSLLQPSSLWTELLQKYRLGI